MKLSLEKWAAKNFDPIPHIDTLRGWARDKKIYPPAQKIGKAYYVDEHAVFSPDAKPRLVHRIAA
ncbi:excisionase [Cupriavidus sp. CV2]|uniref:excisionase n=1 Tax=Cupriavidus ulmosensis TaxID=3065913 RepID=UPI00296B564D|nr:excisionase [Cupriavidus sp. CV2]MDW3684859.1 excisionase [Cupriavidus sp. CV2]